MKFNLSETVRALNGKDMLEQVGVDEKSKEPITEAITYETVIVNAVLGVVDNEKISGEEKLKRYNLAKRIHDKPNESELTSEDKVLIKERVNKFYSVLIYGRVCEFLEK